MKEQSRSPTLAELLRLAIANAQARIHVSLPGAVEAYDATTQRADVKPNLRRTLVDSEGNELDPESLPILMDVPVMFPRGGGGFQSWPLVKGDLVHLVFVERSMDQYLAGDGAETTPLDFRMHSLSDAVAYPGLYPSGRPLSSADPENLAWGFDEGLQLHFTPAGTLELRLDGTADVSVAIAETLKAFLDTTLKNWLVAHTHPTGVGPSGPPVEAPSYPAYDDAITSDKLKLKDN